ncbi:MAG TPA: flavin-dependent oxidoreductase [Crenalkalicoccus sp.]|nr:flavin-dependent oxidoreductase [Crenalkalicoccus sp.]
MAIIGGGIGGLSLALALHQRGIACTVYEATAAIRPLGVGINLLPHATGALSKLGLLPALERVAITTREAAFYTRFGQLVYTEPAGRHAGYATPQLSIHRGDLQMALLEAAAARLGREAIRCGRRLLAVEQDAAGATLRLADPAGAALPAERADAVVGADGIHSALRRQLFPEEGPPIYSGVNMWRGTTRMRPILSGATMVRAGWLAHGKMVIYPIRQHEDGTQLMNWVAEIETPVHQANDWGLPGRLEDFLPAFADWHFDWLDVPAMIRATEQVLEYPMVDKDPLPFWSAGRVTLLGDAAHPMYPRGANGAGQAILDAMALAECLAAEPDAPAALKAYEARRLGPTAEVVRANRTSPPDAILREVWLRSGDRPFARIEDVIAPAELAAMIEGYKRIAGYDRAALASGSERSGPAGR